MCIVIEELNALIRSILEYVGGPHTLVITELNVFMRGIL
jgi:hypothetical protein